MFCYVVSTTCYTAIERKSVRTNNFKIGGSRIVAGNGDNAASVAADVGASDRLDSQTAVSRTHRHSTVRDFTAAEIPVPCDGNRRVSLYGAFQRHPGCFDG